LKNELTNQRQGNNQLEKEDAGYGVFCQAYNLINLNSTRQEVEITLTTSK